MTNKNKKSQIFDISLNYDLKAFISTKNGKYPVKRIKTEINNLNIYDSFDLRFIKNNMLLILLKNTLYLKKYKKDFLGTTLCHSEKIKLSKNICKIDFIP